MPTGLDLLRYRVKPGTTRRAAGFGRPYRRKLGLFAVIVVADAVLNVVQPLLLRAIIDQGILRHDRGVIEGLALVVAALAVVDAGLGLASSYLGSVIGEGITFDLRSKVYRHVLRMPVGFFTRSQTGSLVSRLDNDVMGAEAAFTDLLQSVVTNGLTVLLVLATMVVLAWQITLVLLLAVPLLMVPARLMARRAAGMTKETYRLMADLGVTMTERFNVAGAMLVKIFGSPEREAAYFEERAGRIRDLAIGRSMYIRLFGAGMALAGTLATAAAYGWGGLLVLSHHLQLGTLVALVAFVARLYGPVGQLASAPIDVMGALVSFERLFELFDLVPAVTEGPSATDIPAGAALVSFDHVEFTYPSPDEISLASLESLRRADRGGSEPVLHGVDFTIEPGTMTAVVGPSGAGKTTISHLLRRFYDPTAGTVAINGLDLRDATLASLRDTVGMVTQEAHLFHDTLRANLAYASPSASEADMWEALAEARAVDLVREMPAGLETVVGDRGFRLSGGEKQRIALARLILKSPRVVVLDEATAHLDSLSEAAVQAAMQKALSGRTSLVIAHRLSTVLDADQILVVVSGRIVARGRHQELLAAGGVYAELYRTQLRAQADDGPVPGVDERAD